jgi:hypothetical protein
MVLYETAANAVDVATVLAERLPQSLSGTAVKLYKCLVAVGIETARGKGYSATVTHMVMHLPLEVLADTCGIHRVTAWRHLPALRELGLIAYRAHKGTLRGETRNTGTVFCVRLNPSAGTRARLSYDDLKFKWRDLDRDVKRKRTAYRTVKQHRATVSKTPLAELDISRLTHWTLKPDTSQTPLFTDSCKPRNPVLEALLDVTGAKRGRDTVQRVDLAAVALAVSLSDHGSTDFYRLLVWRCLRASQRGLDVFPVLYQMAIRARVDVQEGFARRGGALLVSRLRQAGLLDEILQT